MIPEWTVQRFHHTWWMRPRTALLVSRSHLPRVRILSRNRHPNWTVELCCFGSLQPQRSLICHTLECQMIVKLSSSFSTWAKWKHVLVLMWRHVNTPGTTSQRLTVNRYYHVTRYREIWCEMYITSAILLFFDYLVMVFPQRSLYWNCYLLVLVKTHFFPSKSLVEIPKLSFSTNFDSFQAFSFCRWLQNTCGGRLGRVMAT